MSKIYQYTASGYFAGEAEFYGVMPNNSTKIAPTLKEGFIPRWVAGKWQQVENHKGKSGYLNGQPHSIKDYGPLPDGWSDTPPPPTFEEVRAAAFEKLRLRKWQAKEAGISVGGIKIDTDGTGQETISGAALNCLINPDFKAKWKTAGLNPDGTAVWAELGKAEIMALAAALTAHTEACFAVEERKQAEIARLESVEAINAWLETELDKGWPNG